MSNAGAIGYDCAMKNALDSLSEMRILQCPSPYVATWVGVLLLALWSTQAWSLPVSGLYQRQIEVENQSEAERQRAYREALTDVIVKVTGERRWLQQPAIQSAIARAGDYISEVSYRAAAGAAFIQVDIDQSMLNGLLNRENIPVWDNNRPSILVLITVQGPDGRRRMLGSSTEHPLLDQSRMFAEQRAVPVLYPILDLTDRQLISPAQAWSLDSSALQALGDRYAADSVLAARVLEVGDGQLVGLWKFLFRDTEDIFDHLATEEGDYMDLPLDRVTAQLASHFGLLPSAFARESDVNIRVDEITDLNSHTQLVQYLRSLSVVQDVQVRVLRPDSVELSLHVVGGQQMLSEFISLGRDLQPVNFNPGDQVSGTLRFRWTR
ncbi:MAG TPA: hypothetical protein DEG76_08805 [Pseudohongiella sp.]|nr:hypothetical protein [Pseudohongiella sp.]MAY56058.1 hypothetical protein [Gammaproteobacteria bacterium]MBJ54876.1 hypothetical protein [Gammaproteobacteria bacterium]HBN14876.1 hypothetical protein [Pseudohongiella sp.]HBX37363.1 hypothetical protein [Pseudohongiella sp.]|tara:strand:- start:3163 stop:4302 length:1140 start_codon:yes stop_codon:yes gene_type:complete